MRPPPTLAEFSDDATRCDNCGAKGRVLKARLDANGIFRRRRRCPDCGKMWFAREVRESPMKELK